jgi:hypothetical protein
MMYKLSVDHAKIFCDFFLNDRFSTKFVQIFC